MGTDAGMNSAGDVRAENLTHIVKILRDAASIVGVSNPTLAESLRKIANDKLKKAEQPKEDKNETKTIELKESKETIGRSIPGIIGK